MTLPAALAVFMDGDLVGYLHDEEPLAFTYAEPWRANPRAKPLDHSIPLQGGRIQNRQVHAFFENLLPEGDPRKLITIRYHVSTPFGMLSVVGGDSAGALVLLPLGETPSPPRYQSATWDQVGRLVHHTSTIDDIEPVEPEEALITQARVSISGAQFKLLISLDDQGRPLLPLGDSPTTHILKPDIVRSDINIFASAVNETLIMSAAGLCGLPTARVAYQSTTRACLVERFDRVRNADGTLVRLWQADFCQLSGNASKVKYEAEGGPSFKECFDLLGRYSAKPAIDKLNLLRWLFFNLYVGNNDTHAKNIAILNTTEGMRLAPFYDLMSTRVYSGLGQHFAFQIGGEYLPGKLNSSHLLRLADELKMTHKLVLSTAKAVADSVERAIPAAAGALRPTLGPEELPLLERLEFKIGSLVRKGCARFLGTNSSSSDSQPSANARPKPLIKN